MASALERAARAVRKIDPELTNDEAEEFARAVLMAVRDAVANDMGNDLWSFQDPEALCIVMRSILNEKDTTND